MFYKKIKNKGFSLVELMVVTSIISIIATISIPGYAKFKIQSSRAEVLQNLRHIALLAKSYHAENEKYYPVIMGQAYFFAYGNLTWHPSFLPQPIYLEECASETNGLGFRVPDCQKLRYRYDFNPIRSSSTSVILDSSGRLYFYATAQAMYATSSDETIGTGAGAPTNRCKGSGSYTKYYNDTWEIGNEGVLANTTDGLRNCF